MSQVLYWDDRLHLGLNQSSIKNILKSDVLIIATPRLSMQFAHIYLNALNDFVVARKITKVLVDPACEERITLELSQKNISYVLQSAPTVDLHQLAKQIFAKTYFMIPESDFFNLTQNIEMSFKKDHWLVFDCLRWVPIFLKQQKKDLSIVQMAQYEWLKFVVQFYDFGTNKTFLNSTFNLIQMNQQFRGLYLDDQNQFRDELLNSEQLQLIELLQEGVVAAPQDLSSSWVELKNLGIIT